MSSKTCILNFNQELYELWAIPMTTKKKPKEGVNIMRSIIHQSIVFHNCYCFILGASPSHPTL